MKRFCLMFTAMALLSGCFVSPDIRFVEASSKTYKAIAPEYSKYVDADKTLTDDQKADRNSLLRSWRKRIEDAKKGVK